MFKWNRLLRKNKLQKDTFSETDTAKEDPAIENEEYENVEMEILPAKKICPDCGGITLDGLEFCD